MKTLFIEARYSGPADFSSIGFSKLPKAIGLVASVQFVHLLSKLKKELLRHGINALIARGSQKYAGQVIGCDASAAKKIAGRVDAFLYIGDGKFHPIAVQLITNKPVFCLNPLSKSFKELDKKDVESYKKRKKGALLKFLNADIVGIIISTKPGQRASGKSIDKLIRKYPKKSFYKFLCDNVDVKQLENFPFIQAWVNTACPRLDEDFAFVSLEDIL